MTLFTDEELGIESGFPCAYHTPGTWGWSVKDADELSDYFVNFDACHLPNPWNDTLLNTRSISYCADPEHSQAIGGYDKPGKPKNAAQVEEEEHCHGPRVHSSLAPDCIRKLQGVLNKILHAMPGYEKHQINYLSVMIYPDENAGIGWHKHDEDNGCDTPVLLVSTGAVRDFYVGEIAKNRKPKEGPDKFWRRPAEHGSLIVLPDAMNYSHWHAILKNTPENRERFGVPNQGYGPRISINTKCLRKPKVFQVRARHPRHSVYVACKYGKYEGTPYGNDHKPFEGHECPIVASWLPDDVKEKNFRQYAEEKMQNPAFREQAIKDLRGKHLLCWCVQDGPERAPFCHARVWLDIVNRPDWTMKP